jgi:hypothetical protein
MRMMITAILMITTIVTLAGAADAGSINRREHRQIARIAQGVRSGQLTARETARLLAEQAAIRAEEYRFRQSGGGLSPWERRDLQRDLNRASRDIYRQTHDAQHR